MKGETRRRKRGERRKSINAIDKQKPASRAALGGWKRREKWMLSLKASDFLLHWEWWINLPSTRWTFSHHATSLFFLCVSTSGSSSSSNVRMGRINTENETRSVDEKVCGKVKIYGTMRLCWVFNHFILSIDEGDRISRNLATRQMRCNSLVLQVLFSVVLFKQN